MWLYNSIQPNTLLADVVIIFNTHIIIIDRDMNQYTKIYEHLLLNW